MNSIQLRAVNHEYARTPYDGKLPREAGWPRNEVAPWRRLEQREAHEAAARRRAHQSAPAAVWTAPSSRLRQASIATRVASIVTMPDDVGWHRSLCQPLLAWAIPIVLAYTLYLRSKLPRSRPLFNRVWCGTGEGPC